MGEQRFALEVLTHADPQKLHVLRWSRYFDFLLNRLTTLLILMNTMTL